MIRTFIVSLVIAAAAFAQGAQKSSDVIALTNVHVHVGDGTVHENATIVISGGKITAVGPGVSVPKSAKRRDMKGAHATPGLIDAAAGGLMGRNETEQISENIAGWRVIDGLDLHNDRMKSLASEGVTTIFATASTSSVIGAQGATVKTGTGATSTRILDAAGSPKITLSHAPSSGNGRPGGTKTVYTRRPTSQMGVNFVARDELTKAREALKEGGGVDPNLRVLGDVIAKKRVIRVLAEEQYEMAMALRLAEEYGYDFVLEHAGEAWRYTKELKAAGAHLVFGPIMAPPRQGRGRFFRPGPKLRPTTARMLANEGIDFCLTAAGNTGQWGLLHQATTAVRHGLSREQALAAVTSKPAKLLGVSDRVGRVAVGLDADLIVWSGKPFEPTSRPVAIMIDGRDVKPRIL